MCKGSTDSASVHNMFRLKHTSLCRDNYNVYYLIDVEAHQCVFVHSSTSFVLVFVFVLVLFFFF